MRSVSYLTDTVELVAGHLGVAEGRLEGGGSAAVPRVQPQGGEGTVVGEEYRELGEAVSAMGAPLLLGLHHLAA